MKQTKRTKRQRAPRGYHIEQWADGFYHVYAGGGCILETLSHSEAIRTAKEHKAQSRMIDNFLNKVSALLCNA